MSTKFWSENLKARDHSEELCVDERIILEWIFGKWGGRLWNGYIWLKLGTNGEPSWTR